jgi:predicted secreted Zn-dependent protease
MNSSSPFKRILIVTILVIAFTACLAGLPGALLNRKAEPPQATVESTAAGGKKTIYAIPTPAIVYYKIQGSTETDLAKEIQSKGPEGYAGYTNWYIRWGWPGFDHEECDLSKAWITTKVSLTMPSWVPPSDAPEDLVRNWARFSQALNVHEQGHVDNVVKALPLLQSAIQNSDCITADSAANHVLDKLRGWDVQYDDNTDHGRTQGAVFP